MKRRGIKKILVAIAAAAVSIAMCFSAACTPQSNSSDRTPGGTPDGAFGGTPDGTSGGTFGGSSSGTPERKPSAYSLSLNYITNLSVDVDGITAYSIKKNLGQNVKAEKAISLLSAELTDDENETDAAPKYYLYSTRENYEYGNVEYDESGITKVTFKKNAEVTEDVYDNEGNLIDSNRTITQDELDSQINKIYTTKEFTYIQFVALVESSGRYPYQDARGKIAYEEVTLRPESMTYDSEGVAEFDKTDYYSSNLTASFVIDNLTGYIYKIEDFHIAGFHNGLIKDSNGYFYAISIDENHNLVFTDVMPNKDVGIHDVMKDCYGWIFVVNTAINNVDRERKVFYTTEVKKYAFDRDKNVYIWKYYANGGTYPGVTHKMVNGEAEPFENHGLLRLSLIYSRDTSYTDVIMYEDLIIQTSGARLAAYNPQTNCGLYVTTHGNLYISQYWLDQNYDTILVSYNDKLYYLAVDLNDYLDSYTTVYVEDTFIQLSDLSLVRAQDYYMSIGNDKYKIDNVYYHMDAVKTSYYYIVRTTTGLELVELTSKTYTENVFIFQPINK